MGGRSQILLRIFQVFCALCLFLIVGFIPAHAMETIFGSTDASRGGFKGDVYVVPEKIDKIPNFSHLRPVGQLYTRVIDVKTQHFDGRLPNATRTDWFAIRYVGRYQVPRAGKYRFRLKSDDGSKLYIDNQLVIDNDGLHGTEDKDEDVRLTAGVHDIEVQYIQGRGEVCLALYVKEPGGKEKHLEVMSGSAGTVTTPSQPVVSQPTPTYGGSSTSSGTTAGTGTLSGLTLKSNGGNTIGYGASGELCMQSMQPGGAWAQKPVPYDLSQPYTVAFDFKITESNNHFILIYYDDFVCVDIDWGKQISHYQPGVSYQLQPLGTYLNPNQWYHFRIDADPISQKFVIFVDGKQVGDGVGIVPGHHFLKANKVVSVHPNTIILGDPEPDTSHLGGAYNRGSACWRNIRYSGGSGGGGQGSDSGGFGTGTFSTTGFKGNIYYLNAGTRSLPNFDQMTPVGSIYTPFINVPPQSFTKGFPGVTDRFEWFGIRYTGSTRINVPGEYQFRVVSDDGSKLWIDGQLIINNDGVHPATGKAARIYLNPGVHDIQLDYFQGPRVMVALQFFMTPPGGTEEIFDGVFQPDSGGGGGSAFGSSTFSSDGFRGNIYYLQNGTRMLPDFSRMTPVGSIYTRSINVPNQSFTKGFPGVTDRFEWFGIRYSGSFSVNQAGQYKFRVFSDDGSKLWIDGKLLINNDGIHPARSGTANVFLNPGVHNIQLDYFQGPRVMVALQLFMTPPGGTESIFEGVYQADSGGGSSVFGGQTYVPGALRGDVYFLNNGTRSLPDFSRMTPVGSIYATSINVPNQSFTKGFPGVTDRFEWFGLRYTGQFHVYQAGEYMFRCFSDDGSKLWIDGQLIINNDGVHPARNGTAKVYLNAGSHNLQLDYFQGPRVMVALQLFITPPGGQEQLFTTGTGQPR